MRSAFYLSSLSLRNSVYWGLLFLLVSLWVPASVLAESSDSVRAAVVDSPASDLWRAVRQREGVVEGKSQVKSMDSGMLINPYGDRWRQFRMEQLLPVAGYILGGMLILVALFYLIRGRIAVEGGVSGKKLFRYTLYERSIHWFTAVVFLSLALTGLALLLGRSLLLPWMGPDLFSSIAWFCKEAHDLLGPLFLVAVLLMFVQFVGRNIYEKGDLTWLLKGGGIIGKGHVPSNFFNMGEKSLFWMLILVGGVIAASGLMLLFPIFNQGRVLLEFSHVAHGIAAVVMMTAVIGHIYIGTIGMEGALDGMTSGYCDLNWAREHHDHWAKACEARGEVLTDAAATTSANQSSADSIPTPERG
ncbi:MAG: formate dehydrogenase subunit gamma [Sedimenticola sp.]|nr:formate dehydrogenase subunit gamma [Sedimenticola sp.]